MPSDDLLEHAKSDQDFYALLGEGIHPSSAENDIRRAYRRTALKHHPDKNKDDPEAVNKFHALQIAFDVLSDPAAKAAYDNARIAREAKKRQKALFEGKRRSMMEDLERRESGVFKRKRDEVDAEEKLEMELRRLQEDGRRRRMEREEALRKEARADMEGDVEVPPEKSNGNAQESEESSSASRGGISVPEIQRTVKVRWVRDGMGESLDKERLSELFSRFGTLESALVLKDRKIRLGESKKKKLVGVGILVFSSIVGAHAAIEDASNGDGLRKVPSFASFSSAKFGTPVSSPFGKAVGTPSLEEITLIRLKNAEKKRLEEKIRREEAEATAAIATNGSQAA